MGKYSLILWESFLLIRGNTFPQYMGQSELRSIFKQEAVILSNLTMRNTLKHYENKVDFELK
ncbi:hypothetical protein ADH74_05105 [Bacteroides caecimuris]|nr:hypothetical protein ADH74_05105 [Bacteroides caecimuris]